ncbi:MAG: hypothetical protein P9L97_01940 [Candidatus Tenebribacter davisii]|nr:hypothetical protein [Candidatus Tenebribacter davisii]
MNFGKKAIEIIIGTEYPAINHSLYNLGIIKSYEIKENNVQIMMALPALNIPILDMLINSFKQPLETMQSNAEIDTIVMTQEELQKFLTMEQSAWKGL